MSPADLAKRIAALDWSATSLQHQLAVGAAVETLTAVEKVVTQMRDCELLASRPVFAGNVVPIPVRPRTRWTVICQLDGREWAQSTHFGPEGAWGWVVECVTEEHGVSEDRVSSLEGSEDQYDGDDLVTVDGVAVYRLRHVSK